MAVESQSVITLFTFERSNKSHYSFFPLPMLNRMGGADHTKAGRQLIRE